MGYNDKLRSIANQYMGSGQPWPASTRTIAGWAIRNELWKPQPSELIGQCADQLARAMREEYIHDPQGRTIRAKHAVREHGGQKNLTLWATLGQRRASICSLHFSSGVSRLSETVLS